MRSIIVTDCSKQAEKFLELELSSAIELADFREGFRYSDINTFACRSAFALCNAVAELKGWDLDALIPEVNVRRAERERQHRERIAIEAKDRAEQDAARRLKNYVKKYGHPPPSANDIRQMALGKLTAEERKVLGV